MIRAVLFDLDGTLADTAPDLAGAVNRQRIHRGLAPLPLEVLRPHASSGARGLIGAGLGITPAHETFETLRQEFLDLYETHLVVESALFEGVEELLRTIDERALAWGIVTNKATRFTLPLVQRIGLQSAGCLVCGDTTPHAKPHPAPLLEAARRIGVAPEACLYVGDDLRDIQAARAAGMGAIAAAYGYLGTGGPLADWAADAIIDQPLDLLVHLP